jgi:hypothetical protein
MTEDKVNKVLYTESYYFQEHEEYTPEQVYSICKDLITVAENKGLTGCYLLFKSNFESHQDYLGPPSITPCGYRKKTEKELEEEAEYNRIMSYALKHGITFYEANTLFKIQGKLGLKL